MSIEDIRRRANTSALNQAAWTEHYRGDVKFLLEQNQRLVEERDSFQRVGIKVQEVNVRLVEALEGMVNIFRDHNGWISVEVDGLTYSMTDEEYKVFVKAKEALQAYKLLENKD